MHHSHFGERFFEYSTQEDVTRPEDEMRDEQSSFLDDPATYEREYEGRLSPFVKEKMYREYLLGKSVKDLSLKYGILHQRVKAIVF